MIWSCKSILASNQPVARKEKSTIGHGTVLKWNQPLGDGKYQATIQKLNRLLTHQTAITTPQPARLGRVRYQSRSPSPYYYLLDLLLITYWSINPFNTYSARLIHSLPRKMFHWWPTNGWIYSWIYTSMDWSIDWNDYLLIRSIDRIIHYLDLGTNFTVLLWDHSILHLFTWFI